MTHDCQNQFIQTMIDNQISVSIYLKSGIRLNGTIIGYDEETVILGGGNEQLIFKHAIATICPLADVK